MQINIIWTVTSILIFYIWELNKLSKQELANDYRTIRIIHIDGWEEQVASYVGYNENIKKR